MKEVGFQDPSSSGSFRADADVDRNGQDSRAAAASAITDEPLQRVLARHNTITQLGEQEREAWIAQLQPMIETWLDGIVADGIADAREIYAEAQRLVAHSGKA